MGIDPRQTAWHEQMTTQCAALHAAIAAARPARFLDVASRSCLHDAPGVRHAMSRIAVPRLSTRTAGLTRRFARQGTAGDAVACGRKAATGALEAAFA
jgi:hypothetical protein